MSKYKSLYRRGVSVTTISSFQLLTQRIRTVIFHRLSENASILTYMAALF